MSHYFSDDLGEVVVRCSSSHIFTTPCDTAEDGWYSYLYSIGLSSICYHSGQKNLSSRSIVGFPIKSSPKRSS